MTGRGPVPEPLDDETRLISALQQLPSRFEDGTPFGVFVFSDGRSTESHDLDQVAEFYQKLGVPIHVFPVGDERISGDVAIQTVDAPRNAAPGTRVPVRVTLRSRGYDGQRVEIQIRHPDQPHAEPLASLPVTLAGGEQSHELVLETDRAKGPITVEVPALPHEAIVANNSGAAADRRAARHDPRALHGRHSRLPKSGFSRMRSRKTRTYAAIRCPWIISITSGRPSIVATTRAWGIPRRRQELFEYDVVICSDIARTAFTQEQLEWTVELVAQRGGGFAMIGGNTSFGGGGWDQTIWDGMIPIDMSGQGPVRSQDLLGFVPRGDSAAGRISSDLADR